MLSIVSIYALVIAPILRAGDVRRWLELEGLGEWGDAFEAQSVDGGTLMGLATRDLKEELGVGSLPARKAIKAAVERLRGAQQ
jgi:hypothetical protein